MSKFLVPIDSSNLRKVLPVGQDITHSLYMKIKFDDGYGNRYDYKSHILCTSEGIAWILRDWKNNEEMVFTPWNEVELIKPKTLYLKGYYRAKHIREQENQTKKDFEKFYFTFYIETMSNAVVHFQEEVNKLPEKSESKEIRTKRAKLSAFVKTFKKKVESIKKKAKKKGYIE